MLDGKVKWFADDKGYGFIASGGKDYFVHFKSIKTDGFKSLEEGMIVRFNPIQGKKGLQAEDVIVILSADDSGNR